MQYAYKFMNTFLKILKAVKDIIFSLYILHGFPCKTIVFLITNNG